MSMVPSEGNCPQKVMDFMSLELRPITCRALILYVSIKTSSGNPDMYVLHE